MEREDQYPKLPSDLHMHTPHTHKEREKEEGRAQIKQNKYLKTGLVLGSIAVMSWTHQLERSGEVS